MEDIHITATKKAKKHLNFENDKNRTMYSTDSALANSENVAKNEQGMVVKYCTLIADDEVSSLPIAEKYKSIKICEDKNTDEHCCADLGNKCLPPDIESEASEISCEVESNSSCEDSLTNASCNSAINKRVKKHVSSRRETSMDTSQTYTVNEQMLRKRHSSNHGVSVKLLKSEKEFVLDHEHYNSHQDDSKSFSSKDITSNTSELPKESEKSFQELRNELNQEPVKIPQYFVRNVKQHSTKGLYECKVVLVHP